MPTALRPFAPALLAAALALASCDAGPEPATPAVAREAVTGNTAAQHEIWAAQGLTCASCHPCGKRSGHPSGWMDAASTGFHAYSANQGLGPCASCHGATLDGGSASGCGRCHDLNLPAGVASWKVNCVMCHGGTDNATGAPPQPTWGSTDPVRVGTHTSHVAATHGLGQPITCATCHPVPLDALSDRHVDGGTPEVEFTGLPALPAGPPTWDRASATCANVYCHGASLAGGAVAAPTWTLADGTQRACAACHGAPPPAPHSVNPACGDCHPGYGASGVDPARHVDGNLDLALTCRSCHGSATSDAPPRGTRLEVATTTRAVGAHQAHLAGGTLAAPVACTECHAVPTAMEHSDGAVDLAWGPRATARATAAGFDPAALTCSNYCHGASIGHGGSNKTPSWTAVDGTQDACGTCHGAPPPGPHTANPDCGLCHVGYTLESVNVATHVDGKRDVKDLTCNTCHGSPANAAPPQGTAGETATTTRAVGAHQQHLVAGTLRGPIACEECHPLPAPDAMDHADAEVQLAFGPLARTDGAAASWDPVALTCSNYCHGAILRGGGTNLAPLWTGGPSQVACGTCHMTPPPEPHPHTAVCDNCHPGYLIGTVNLTTHLNGVVEADNLTCSSCHGDNSRVLVTQADPLAIAAPPYGSRGELDPTSRSVGQHQAHVSRGDGIAIPNKCRYCHAVPAAGAFAHADGVSQVTFGSLATMDGAAPTFDGNACANTYCHGSTLGRGGTDHAPTWTNPAPVTCASCHGVPPPLPHPQDADCIRCHPGYTATTVRKWTHVNGVSDFPSGCNSCHDMPPNTGEHYEHLHENVACYRCHAGYTLTTANETLHRNARQDVTLSGWNPTNRTCSSISCHGSEYWGRTGTAARQSCNQCHGVPPRSGEHYEHSEYACSRCHGTGYTTTTTNAASHMNGAVDVPFAFYTRATLTCSNTGCHGTESWGARLPVTPNCSNCHGFPPPLPHPQQTACQSCHSSMLSTGVLTTAHNNGTLDISGAGCATCHGAPPTTTRAGGLHTTDANCYGCHSTTVNATNEIVPNGTHNDGHVQVGGGGVGTYGCQSCHGDQKRTIPAGSDPETKSAPPLGTRGESEPTTRAVGAHLAHVTPGAGAIAPATLCGECHVVPTAMDHATGTVVMSFAGRASAGGAAPRFDAATLTCLSTYCHGATLGAGGTNTTPSWVDGVGHAACGTCHASPPPAPHTASTACGECHEGYTATTVNAAEHVDGEVDVLPSTCDDCHGSAQNAAPPKGVQGETKTTTRAVGAHQAHLAEGALAKAFACGECHVVPSSMAHVDGNPRVVFGPIGATGAPGSFDATALTCSTYCHGATLAAGGTLAAPLWTKVDGSQVACGACHGVPPPAPHSSNPSCGGCHDGYTSTTVNVAIHVDGRTEVGSLTCSSCHGSPTNAAPPMGVDGDTATTTIAVGAHQQHLQGGLVSAPIACSECHVVPTSMGHADATAQVAFGAVATTDGAVPEWDRATATCSTTYCHGQFVGGNLLNAPSWTTVNGTQAACGSCHAAPPPAPHVAATTCDGCHAGYGPASVNLSTHVDGHVDITPGACTACHGSAANAAPPTGTKGETAETSRAVGAHQQHLAGGPLRGPMACTECHAVPTDMGHVDGAVQLVFGPLASTDGAVPTFDGTALTCSNYCHGQNLRGGGTNLTPAWTGGDAQVVCGSCHGRPPPAPHPYTQICDNCHPGYTLTTVNPATHVNGLVEADNLTCSSCHGDNSRVLVQQADPLAIAAPPYGSRGETDPSLRSVGQHQAHVSRGDGIAVPNKCRYCHAVPTTFDHADGVSQVTFDSLATMDGATPTFDGQRCANTYCHGATLGRGGTDHAPNWLNPTPVTCTTCHGSPPPPPHPQEADCLRCHPGYTATTVRKATHVNGVSDFPSGCNSCHDIPPNTGDHYEHLQRNVACSKCHAGYTQTTANETLHRNAVQDVTLSGWNAAQRTCSSNSCHWTRYWGRTGDAARTSCNQCHGVPPASGEHFQHSEYACSRCHGTGFTTTTTNPATHMNGVNDVPYSFYNRTSRTCSNTGCHGSEYWGTAKTITPNCANCHGFPPGLPHPQQSACQSCHPSMLSTGALTADHNNGALDLSGTGCTSCHGMPPSSTRAGGVHPADANCYGCHSTTVDAANALVANGTHNDGYVQIGGGGVGTYGCQSCHGDQARTTVAGSDPNVKSAPPLGTRGETEATTRAVGAHVAHVNKGTGAMAAPAQCAECHVVPSEMGHAMGTVLMSFGGRATADAAVALWNPETLGCTNYCHGATLGAGGTNHAPTWTGGPAEAACGTCHDAPPPAPHSTSTNCGACHVGYTATTVDPSTHVDGIIQSWSHPTDYAGALHGADANRQGLAACATCHGADLAGGTAGVSCGGCHATAGFGAWDTTCTFCHGDRAAGTAAPPLDAAGGSARTSVSVGAHATHVGADLSNPIACGECHPARTASVVTDAGHVDGDAVAEVTFGPLARTGGAAAAYSRASATSATCASTYCHGAFSGGANAAMEWTSTTPVGCTSCHGAPPPAPHSTSTDCGSCHAGYTATTVVRATHVDGVLQVTSPHVAGYGGGAVHGKEVNLTGFATCKGCHGADLAGGTGRSCASCHAGWDTTCTFCHGDTAAARSSPPVDIQGRSVTTNVSVGRHDSHVTSTIGVVACGECHPARTASVISDAAHVDGNGVAEVAFGAIARTGGAAATYTRSSATSASCASTYCHGKFSGGANSGRGVTMTWTGTTQVSCTSCHGNPPGTGKHSKHSSKMSCWVCHNAVVNSSKVIVDKTLHLNGVDNVKFGGTYNSRTVTGTWNPTSRSCSSLSCHSSESW